MNPPSAETDNSFAVFPPPDGYKFTHKSWIPQTTSAFRFGCIESIIGKVKHEYDHLYQTNQTLTDALRQLSQENDKLC